MEWQGRTVKHPAKADSAPTGHWYTTTMIGSVRLNGTIAFMTIEEVTDTDIFGAYVQRVLIPTPQLGNVLILDNLPPHKNSETIRWIEQAGPTFGFCRCIPPT